jgi:alpha-aminoadipic semialdehyde synthase
MNGIGIRKEDVNLFEKRAPLTPNHVKQLSKNNIRIVVQPSNERVFDEESYINSGAEISNDLSTCNVILGVKEIPIVDILPEKTYLFFSHTVKGQTYNMPLLKALIEKKATLIDYELIKDSKEKRLVFFGDFAGYAGIINTLWAFGERIFWEGKNNLFKPINQTVVYDGLTEARAAISEVGENIRTKGTRPEITPLVIGVTGRGRVSKGVMEILDLLPIVEIAPEDLADFINKKENHSPHSVYVVRFMKGDLYKPKDGESSYDAKHFMHHHNEYESNLEKFIPYLSILVNGIYWEPKFPKLLTKEYLRNYYSSGNKSRLKVIGDITCDIEGSIECTVKATDWKNPLYVYNPITGYQNKGWEGDGIVMMTVDKLPTELPREASNFFGNSLLPFLEHLAKVDLSKSYEELKLPHEFRDAVIVHKGKLTPKYQHLEKLIYQQ